jgi:hypothetical protein
MACSGSSVKLMGDSDAVETDELRLGGDREGILDEALDDEVE